MFGKQINVELGNAKKVDEIKEDNTYRSIISDEDTNKIN